MTATEVKHAKAHPRLGLVIEGLMVMTARERWGALGIVVIMMMAGLLETAVVALILPLVYVLVDPTAFTQSEVGAAISALAGGQSLVGLFPFIAATLIVLLVLSGLLSTLSIYLIELHSARSRTRLARELLEECLRAPYLWISSHKTAVLVRHLNEDIRYWRKDFIQSILMMVQAGIMIVAPAAVVIALAPVNGIIAIGIVGLLSFFVMTLFRRATRENSVEVKRRFDRVNQALLQTIAGSREIKISGKSEFFISRFNEYNTYNNDIGIRTRLVGGAPASIINLLGQVGLIVTALVLWASGIPTTEIVGQLALIGVVVSRVVPAANRLASQVSTLFRSAPFVDSLLRFRNDLRVQSTELAGTSPVLPSWRTLRLEDASFSYPRSDRQSLQDANLLLERGKLYGFVGRSGAGKTTLVNLLLGLIRPSHGAVLVDKQDLREVSLPDWHRRFGYVPQDAFILDATLRENVTFGEDADHARLSAAIEGAQLAELVKVSGVDASLGEKGRRLSGGQAQRVAIARALFKQPEILLLDEATSALDSITETHILNTVRTLPSKPLGLIIAHRVSTLRACERIFILDGGKIAESGTYDELMARSQIFRALAAVPDPVEPETAQ
jgi:ABC-type multidrug transport system fused ATPase/permease subunit